MARDVKEFFPQVQETAEGWRANCPRCGDQGKRFYWNTQKRVGCCFHADCYWAAERHGVTERRLLAFFSREGVEYATPEVLERADEADIGLPEEFKLLADLPRSLSEDLYSYLQHRGLVKKILNLAQVGYCSTGKFWGYIIFPVFNQDGKLVYWQGRRYKAREKKFLNPDSSHKSELLYRISAVAKPRLIVLVESILNALTLENINCGKHRTGNLILALLGSSLSEAQLDQILLYERWIKQLVIALDPDAWHKAVDLAARLKPLLPDVRLARFPAGQDVNSLGREASWQAIYNAIPFTVQKRMQILHRVET